MRLRIRTTFHRILLTLTLLVATLSVLQGCSSGPNGGSEPGTSVRITALSVTSGMVGTPVTINGTNFGTTQGTSTVTFNGVAAAPTGWSATSIMVTVPSGATTGNMVVTVGGVASNGMSFTVTSAVPSIASLSPTSGPVGTSVAVTGANFGATQGASTVTFNGNAATPASWSATSIVVPVPTGAMTGNVVVTAGGVASNGVNFTVTVGSAPSVTTLNPNSGVATSVAITGTNFGATQGTSTVEFNGTAGIPTSWSATSIVVPVPIGATTGNVVVTAGGVASNGVNFTVTATGPLTVTISPNRAGLTISQALPVTATTNDPAGVNWTTTGSGGFSASPSFTGIPVTYTAPATAGVYTVTATSVTDVTKSASITVAVTDLAGVYTYHNNLARNGANTQEYALTPTILGSSAFGKLFSCITDGVIYAQPLWAARLTVNGAKHNVVFVATQHDSVYAFDADANPCVTLWHANLLDANHGGTSGETSVPDSLVENVGVGGSDISPEIGVTGTPVIDPSTNTMYVVSKSSTSDGTVFQRLHAIDITTGNEKFAGPANITSDITYPGVGDGGSTVSFSTHFQNQRAGLALVNGTVYVAWASHGDILPYYGWVVAFSASSLAITHILNVSPNVQYGGIWMGGGAPAADNNNNLYLITGNATFDVTNPSDDYGDSALQLSPSLAIKTYFTPSDQSMDNAVDHDFGAGGVTVIVNDASASPSHLVVGGGKDGALYLLNGDSMGGLGDTNARQFFNIGKGIFSTGAFWNNEFYIAGTGPLVSYSFDSSSKMFNPTTATHQSATSYGFPGASPSISATGASSNGIVWALANSSYCTSESKSCGPAVLHAYDATNVATELWNSSVASGDAAGYAVKFTVPTIANGKVYVPTRGNNIGGADSSTSIPGELDVYGLKPN